jgi:hypothetical protein
MQIIFINFLTLCDKIDILWVSGLFCMDHRIWLNESNQQTNHLYYRTTNNIWDWVQIT